MLTDFLFPLLAIFLVIVLPIWLVMHYVTRNSADRKLNSKDEALLDELNASTRKMEDRIRSLERILDADSPNWRNRL